MFLVHLGTVCFLVVTLLGAILSGHSANASAMTARAVVLPAGIVGTLIGVIAVLANMSDPAAIAPAMARALLPALYAAIVKLGLDVYISEQPAEVRRPVLPLSAAGVVLWIVAVVVMVVMNTGGFVTVVNLGAMAATVISILGILGFAVASGRGALLDRLARHLPHAGLVIFMVGLVGVLHSIDDPSAVGPHVALALLGLLYTTVLSVSLKLVRPDQITFEPSTSQWLFWAASLLGVVGSLGFILLSVGIVS